MSRQTPKTHILGSALRRLFHGLLVLGGTVALTLAFFLVLPLMQTINQAPLDRLELVTVNTGQIEPPPPAPPEPEPQEEPEPQDEPPDLAEDVQLHSLEQMNLALNPPAFGSGWGGIDINAHLDAVAADTAGTDAIFSLSDLDQQPRPLSQPPPVITPLMRKKVPGTVRIAFIVNELGRVENPIVQSSTDPVFERPALAAVSQWRFEPGRRGGKPVRFRMRVPMTFPKGQ